MASSTPPDHPEKVGLPVVTFLYTLDQIGSMLSMNVEGLATTYIYFQGRSLGIKKPSEMLARNIADEDKEPDWRVPQGEFVRWLRLKGFRVTALGKVT